MDQNLFLKKLSVFTLSVAVLIVAVQQVISKYPISNSAFILLAYYYALSFATGMITHSGLKKDNKTFMTRTYSAIGIRFVFSIFPLLIYLLFSNSRDFALIVVYILLYFFYTSFEIYFLVVNLRPDYKK